MENYSIREVWKHNLEEEFRIIRVIVKQYPYISVGTVFPGVVARPIGEFRNIKDLHYQVVRCNVNILNIIQLGLSFMEKDGNFPSGYSTWQFNFKFNLPNEMYAQNSIDNLMQSGVQFEKHESDGIDPFEFAELLMMSGVVLVDEVKLLTFNSDYDFAYILKMLTNNVLPDDEEDYLNLMQLFFPNIFDIKCLIEPYKELKGASLHEVADQLHIQRVKQPAHLAGSDSLLTARVFFQLKSLNFGGGECATDDFKGLLYGMNNQKDVVNI